MKIFGRYIPSKRLFQIVFHLVLWTAWISYPFIAGPDDERFRKYATAIIPVTLTHIPFFLFNSDWLIPKVFRKRGIAVYLAVLIAMVVVATLGQTALKEMVVPHELLRRHWDFSWMLLGVIFVTGVSTGYGFVFYLMDREQAMRESQEEQLKSELSFLRSQISPHFIFNVLNSLVYLIRNKPKQAESITIRLSELMRYMLYESGDRQVILKKELEYLKNYVELQTMRFGEDVEINFHLNGQHESHQIEPMLIIPFVENAFKHGIGMIDHPVIDISVDMKGNKLVLQVRNKIPPNVNEVKDDSSGIGLKNVRRRLELLYPEKHNLLLEQKDHQFLTSLSIELTSLNGD